MKVNFEVKGAKELERFLIEKLPATVSRRVLLSSLRKSSKPTIALAKATAKGVTGVRKSGALAASIGQMTIPYRKLRTIPLPPGISMQDTVASIAIGPLSGQGANALLAWAMYRAYYKKGVIRLKKGSPVGRIRHGHFVEFGFTHRGGKKVPGTHFLEKAAEAMGSTTTNRFRMDLKKGVERAIQKHNQTSPARSR